MTFSEAADQAWLALGEDVVSTIDPARLSQCFDSQIAPELCAMLKASPRLRERLCSIVQTKLDLPPLPADLDDTAGDKTIAVASPEELMQIVGRAGAIYWARAITSTVLAADVAAIQQEIGEERCRFAVKNRDLASPYTALPPHDDLANEVASAGWSCLAAWCEAVDLAIGVRVRLKLPINAILDEPPSEEFRERGPKIIRRAATA